MQAVTIFITMPSEKYIQELKFQQKQPIGDQKILKKKETFESVVPVPFFSSLEVYVILQEVSSHRYDVLFFSI